MDQADQYLALIQMAYGIGSSLVDLIKGHAKQELTPEEYARLEAGWDELVARTELNAKLTD